MKHIDYYFATISPWMFLGHERFVDLVRKHRPTVSVRPINFGEVFPVSGGLPLSKRAPQRQAYRLVELKRWSEHLGIRMNIQPKYFPANGDLAAYYILAAGETGTDEALAMTGAVGRALWVEDRDVARAETLNALAKEVGLDVDPVVARARSSEIAARYGDLTQEAIGRGVFGAPTYVCEDELFWGQDRLDFLARKLAK
jgi:2-hydroxychromene-2-carboxylate isomerase